VDTTEDETMSYDPTNTHQGCTDRIQAEINERDNYITGKYSLEDQELHDDEAPEVDDGCDVGKMPRGHDEP
jgi:hypothetical protein